MALFLTLLYLTLPPRTHPSQKAIPTLERVTENVYRIGKVLVDTNARTVSCRGVVNMDSGAIEYLAVAPGGKLHESLFRLDIQPMHLQIGLLLLGLEPKQNLKSQGDPAKPLGAPVIINIRWLDIHGKKQELPAEQCIIVMPGAYPVQQNPFVFTGSRILKSGFEADISRSIAAVWHDPAALVDNASASGADNSCFVNKRIVPRRGTQIEFIISSPAAPASGNKEQTKS